MRSASASASSFAGSNGTHSGTRLVCTRWSGHGAPTLTSSGAAREDTNSSAFGDSSTQSSFARADEVAPRIAGSSCISVAWRVASSSSGTAGPPKRRAPLVRSLTNAMAVLIASIVAW